MMWERRSKKLSKFGRRFHYFAWDYHSREADGVESIWMEMKFAYITQQASYTQHLSELAGGDKRRRNPRRCRLTLSRPSYFSVTQCQHTKSWTLSVKLYVILKRSRARGYNESRQQINGKSLFMIHLTLSLGPMFVASSTTTRFSVLFFYCWCFPHTAHTHTELERESKKGNQKNESPMNLNLSDFSAHTQRERLRSEAKKCMLKKKQIRKKENKEEKHTQTWKRSRESGTLLDGIPQLEQRQQFGSVFWRGISLSLRVANAKSNTMWHENVMCGRISRTSKRRWRERETWEDVA